MSHLFFKPLQIQTYDKKVGGHGILCPPRLKKWGTHVPRVPHQIAPMREEQHLYLRSVNKQ